MKGNNSHLKTFFSGSLISIVGVGITGVLNYFIRRTLFMNMSEADYGTFYSAVAFLLMVGGFAELGLSQTGALLIAENNTGSQKTRKISSCFSSLLSLKLILATVVLILLLSCSRWILKDYLRTGNGLFYYLLAGMLFFQILECTFYPLFSGLKDFVSYNFLQVTKALLLLSGIALFSRSGQLPAAAAVFFSVAILIVFIAGTIAFFREKIRLSWHPDRAVWTRLFQLSGFIAVSTTLLNMIYYMDTVMLTAIKGVTSSALYNVALPIMQIVQAAMVFPLIILPVAVQMSREKRYLQLKQISLWAIGVAAVAFPVTFLFFHLLSPWLIRILFSAQYLAAAPAVSILCSGLIFYTLGSFLMQIVLTMGGAGRMALITLFTSICNVILNWCLISLYDYIGAACATAGSYLIFSLATIVVLRQLIRKREQEML